MTQESRRTSEEWASREPLARASVSMALLSFGCHLAYLGANNGDTHTRNADMRAWSSAAWTDPVNGEAFASHMESEGISAQHSPSGTSPCTVCLHIEMHLKMRLPLHGAVRLSV
jgi:hypothetical protein